MSNRQGRSMDGDRPLLFAGFLFGNAGAVGTELFGHGFEFLLVGGEAAGMSLGFEQVSIFADHGKERAGEGFFIAWGVDVIKPNSSTPRPARQRVSLPSSTIKHTRVGRGRGAWLPRPSIRTRGRIRASLLAL
jgi:hypothetical protein